MDLHSNKHALPPAQHGVYALIGHLASINVLPHFSPGAGSFRSGCLSTPLLRGSRRSSER